MPRSRSACATCSTPTRRSPTRAQRVRSRLRPDARPQRLRAPDLHVPMSSPAQDSRRFAEIGGFGFAVVAVVALVTAFSELLPMLFGRPFAKWLADLRQPVRDEPRHRPRDPDRRRLGASPFSRARPGAIRRSVRHRDHRDDARDTRPFLWDTRHARRRAAGLVVGRVLLALASNVVQCGILGLVITAAWLYTRIETEHTAAVAQCAVDSARMDEQAAEARLQMLEAQIEPHFLFNTLAQRQAPLRDGSRGGRAHAATT